MAKKELIFKPNKMGDFGIKNDKGTNVIFHANMTRKSSFKYKEQLQVETPALSTRQDLLTGGECPKDRISVTNNAIIQQNVKKQTDKTKVLNKKLDQSLSFEF